MPRITPAICLAALLAPAAAVAHSGGLNAEGCHTNRKTGDYHCHRSGAPRPAAPAAGAQRRQLASEPMNVRPGGARGAAFANCTQARAAGAAPVRRGDPGYGPHLDRDNDGVGCE